MDIDFTSFKVIDKTAYGKRLKIAFFAACSYLLIVGVSCSTLLIHFMGNQPGDNFWYNLLGVAIALASALVIYAKIKHCAFLSDIVYIRQIKAQLNYIYRKQAKLLDAAAQGDIIAMSILSYNYRAARYVYELDNNTLTIDELDESEKKLENLTQEYQATLIDYHPDLLKNY